MEKPHWSIFWENPISLKNNMEALHRKLALFTLTVMEKKLRLSILRGMRPSLTWGNAVPTWLMSLYWLYQPLRGSKSKPSKSSNWSTKRKSPPLSPLTKSTYPTLILKPQKRAFMKQACKYSRWEDTFQWCTLVEKLVRMSVYCRNWSWSRLRIWRQCSMELLRVRFWRHTRTLKA